MKTKRSSVLISSVLLLSSLFLLSCDINGDSDNWTLVWSDEFNGTSLDGSNWNYDIGTGAPDLTGWGNNELEYYTNRSENIRIEDFTDSNGGGRALVIEARQESYGGSSYTSARINSKEKQEFTFGKIEARIKLPIDQGNSRGIWPAFWMLGANIETNSWPECGEIDIMEAVGSEADTVHGNLHYGLPWTYTGALTSRNHYSIPEGDLGDDFHLYSIEWLPGEIRWLIDDYVYFTQKSWYSTLDGANAPFDRDFFILLNVAVGGDWPGNPDSSTTFPKQMIVDYVRVYE